MLMEKEREIRMDEKVERIITNDGLFDITDLNEKQILYWMFIYPQSGVLFLTSEPGIAKSATLKDLAKKVIYVPTGEPLNYIDLRLAMLDETDVGLFPDKYEIEYEDPTSGKIIKERFLDHITPRWAHIANETPTLIHFEELNRAPLAVRNAALQILLDREIGYNFKFNDAVFMAATGNLGDEDGTDVEEFDEALNGRLIHYKHTMTLNEWIQYYAKEHIHPSIINYLIAHPEKYYVARAARNSNDPVYASPRTWTFLSDSIMKNFGRKNKDGKYNNFPKINSWISYIEQVGSAYVGASNTGFVRYLNELINVSIHDILDRYTELKEKKITFLREKKSELLSDLKQLNIKEFKPNQISHLKDFLHDLHSDEVTSYLLWLMDNEFNHTQDKRLNEIRNKFILSIFRDERFEKYHEHMLSQIEDK